MYIHLLSSNMDLENPTNLSMYQHSGAAMDQQSDNNNPAHVSYSEKQYYNNLTAQQQYDQLPLRKEEEEEGRICAVVLPKTDFHLNTQENDHPSEENGGMNVQNSFDNDQDSLDDGKKSPDDIKNSLDNVQTSLEAIKTEIEDDIDSFMKAAHDTFLKVSSKEMKIREAAELLGRPYSFVYSRYQEFCDTITGVDEDYSPKKKKNNSIVKKRKKKKSKRLTLPNKTPKKYKKLYQCDDCPATFGTEAAVKKHTKVHLDDNESHICTSCDMVFPKLNQLMKHRIEVHEDALQCPHCDKQYTNIPAYQAHIKTVHSKVRPFSCEECGKGFFSRVKLEDHAHIHTGFKPFMCGLCEKTFTSISNLNGHHKTIHLGIYPGPDPTNPRNFKCEECGKGFATSFRLDQHIKSHTGEKPFACDQCDSRFGLKANWKRHMLMHQGIKQPRKSQKDMPKNFECEECGLRVVSNFKLKLHMYVHTGEKPYACDQCDARFNQKVNLKRHKLIHTGEKPFICNYCPAAYASKIDLKRHNMVHTGYKPFKCELCDYSCVKKHSLEHHMNTHTGKTPFKCDFEGCGAEYSSRSTLYQHKLKHLPPPLKTCKICNEKFPDSNSLNRHMMLHPGNEPLPCNQCDKVFYNQSSLNRHAYVHVYKAPGNKPKSGQSRPRKKKTVVKRVDLPVTPQKKFPTQYEIQTVPENGHSPANSISQSWTINAESLNSQSSQQLSHQVNQQLSHQVSQQLSHQVSQQLSHQVSQQLSHQVSQQLSHQVTQQVVGQQSIHHALPSTQFTNSQAWPQIIDPDELRHRLLSSFK